MSIFGHHTWVGSDTTSSILHLSHWMTSKPYAMHSMHDLNVDIVLNVSLVHTSVC